MKERENRIVYLPLSCKPCSSAVPPTTNISKRIHIVTVTLSTDTLTSYRHIVRRRERTSARDELRGLYDFVCVCATANAAKIIRQKGELKPYVAII